MGFKKLLGEILVTLAAHFPVNDIDPRTLLPVDPFEIDQAMDGDTSATGAAIAAQHGDVRALKLLAEAKADLMKPRRDDVTTPSHRAVLNNHYEAAAFLIAHYRKNNKNIFVKHKDNQSPFLFACCQRNWEIAKLFVDNPKEEKISVEDGELLKTFRVELNPPVTRCCTDRVIKNLIKLKYMLWRSPSLM